MSASRPRFDWLSWLLIAVMVGASYAVWNRVPELLPIHWNWQGEPDRFTSRDFALTMLPLFGVGIKGLFWLLTRGLPVRENARVSHAARLVVQGVLGVFTLAHLALVFGSLGGHVNVPRVTIAGSALLLILLGWLIRTIPPNRVIGLRLAATLSDPDIWRKTHQLACWLLVGVGVLTLAATMLSVAAQVSILVIGVLGTASISYAFALWLRSRDEDGPSDHTIAAGNV